MANLKSKSWIVVKGALFLQIVLLCAGLLLQESPSVRTALLISFLIWASARFYYFLFYVLERYVDQSLKYAGVMALLQEIWLRGRKTRPDDSQSDCHRPRT